MMETEEQGERRERRSKKRDALSIGLWGLCVSYGAASFEKYGASSLGLGLALLGLAVISLAQEIRALSKFFGRRKGEGNER